jgi:serine/threonine protein phosphatase 1
VALAAARRRECVQGDGLACYRSGTGRDVISRKGASVGLRFRLSPRRSTAPAPTTGGRLVYAVGDVHGRFDLLEPLLEKIDADAAEVAGEPRPALVFVGDYVDRGRDSRSVIERIIRLQAEGAYEVRALKGNHEEALLDFLADATFGPTWAEYGGLQTIVSYGVSPPLLRSQLGDWERTQRSFADALPQAHVAFLANLELTARYGDYVFVHAGVRPGVPLSEQLERDLLWIRDEFLRSPGPHEAVVVHGHSPEPEPFVGQHRIGIDTGAYATGVLTAVRLHATEQKILQSGGR